MNETLRPCRNSYRRQVLLDLPPNSIFMYREENNMSTRHNPPPITTADGFDAEFSSEDVIVVGNHWQKQFVLVGAVTANRSLTFFSVIKRAGNMHAVEVYQPDILEGETPEEVIVLRGDDWRELLKQYASVTAEKMHVKPVDSAKNLTGYCTWYYYY